MEQTTSNRKVSAHTSSLELYGSDKTILMFISNLDKIVFMSVMLPFEGALKVEI
jgi:hypothetical protein